MRDELNWVDGNEKMHKSRISKSIPDDGVTGKNNGPYSRECVGGCVFNMEGEGIQIDESLELATTTTMRTVVILN